MTRRTHSSISSHFPCGRLLRLGSALIRELIDAADNWLGFKRLELTVYTDNAPAIRLYERFGFEREGIRRSYAFKAGAYVDALGMARLRY
ncbi:GNAT family N-acetyltransferase [Phyllobacterium ifriqiyense]|uniref:GNAT family N-acetyltransferase n=1 Tax=Phyllobacterium ifriqiyense TaxID=314238 RepID=UPI00339896FD